MRLTKFSDYAIRVLIFAGRQDGGLATIEETATRYGISRAHLKKVVLLLTRAGFLQSLRGRHGGFTLARRPEEIRLGDIIRVTEPDFALVECFDTVNRCLITRGCGLPPVLNEALAAFMAVLDKRTLAEVLVSERYFTLPAGKVQPKRGHEVMAV